VRLYACFIDASPSIPVYNVDCVFILDGGSATEASDVVDATFDDTIRASSSSVLLLSKKPGVTDHHVHIVEATNAAISRVNDTTWIFSEATGPVTLTVSSQTVSDRGIQSLCISGITDDGTEVSVHIGPSTEAGLPGGRFSVIGICHQPSDSDMTAYTNVSTASVTIEEGSGALEIVLHDIAPLGSRLYCAYVLLEYGIYDLANDSYSNKLASVAVLAPSAI